MNRSMRRVGFVVFVFASACAGGSEPGGPGGVGEPGGPGAPGGGGDNQALRVQISLIGDECGVASADALVTAADMAPIGPVALEVGAASIEGSVVGVPVGAGRTVVVRARNSQQVTVYEGSAQVDVSAGQTVSAEVILARNFANCPEGGPTTGSIDVSGTIDNGAPGDVLTGPEFAFTFSEATLGANGVVHFLDTGARRVRRLDLATRSMLPAIVGSDATASMTVAPDGAVAYFGYSGGRIDVADLVTGDLHFFAAAPTTVSSMIVTGGSLFTVDDSGAWDTHSLFDRTTGTRTDAEEWRDSTRALVYSPTRGRVYYLDSGVSPTDVHTEQVNLPGGTLGGDSDSPYHGSYALPNPLRLLPDESGVIVGSGIIFNTTDLTYRTSIGLPFDDIAFLDTSLYLIDQNGPSTRLRTLSATFDIVSTREFPGAPRTLFAHDGGLVLITEGPSSLEIRFVSP
jgi:hypothetical protein